MHTRFCRQQWNCWALYNYRRKFTSHTSSYKIFVPVHALRAYRGSRGLVLLSLKLGTTCRSTCLPDHFASRKHSYCTVNTRLGGPQRQWEYFGKQKNFLPLREFENHSPWLIYCILSYAGINFLLQACGYIIIIRIPGCQATTPHNIQ
jgi:hypothetical protein